MAIRINVTAVRGGDPLEVRAVMSEVIRPACRPAEDCQPVGDLLQLHEHNGWTWFNTSVWGVGADDLNRGLCRLAHPALQFTTSDGDRWYLTVHGGPQGRVTFAHEFSMLRCDPDPADDAERQAEAERPQEQSEVDPQLAFLEDDPLPGRDRPRTAFDLFLGNGTDLSVPEDFRASVADLPYSEAVARYRRWHAGQILSALRQAGIEHDEEAVRATLLWEGVTENESGGDLGNLPRLLHVLGLGGDWDDYIRQAETPPQEVPDEHKEPPQAPPEPEPDPVAPVLAIVDAVELRPVAGGPVGLPLRDMARVRFFVDALTLSETAGVVVSVALPANYDRARLEVQADRGGAVEFTPEGFRFGLLNHLWFGKRDLRDHLGKRLGKLLYHLPDGATLDVAFAQAGFDALTQRYRGEVRDETWWVGESFPALTHRDLLEGLELAELGEPQKVKCRDVAEALALVAAAGADPDLWNLKVESKGKNVRCEMDFGGNLVKLLFRLRHAGQWGVAAFDARARDKLRQAQEQHRQMRRAAVEAGRRRAAPHEDEVLLQGQHGIYWRSDFARLTELEQETRGTVDTAMGSLGFRHLGDLVAKKQRDIVLRFYGNPDGTSYGVLMGKRTMYLGYEFFSRFADGSTLTTTTNGSADSRPEAGVFYKLGWGSDVPTLFAKHQWGQGRFLSHRQTRPVPLELSLLGAARELDAAMVRSATARAETIDEFFA